MGRRGLSKACIGLCLLWMQKGHQKPNTMQLSIIVSSLALTVVFCRQCMEASATTTNHILIRDGAREAAYLTETLGELSQFGRLLSTSGRVTSYHITYK